MDYLRKISIIIEKIESAGKGDLAEEVSNVVKDAIESDVIELREYCWSIGLAVQ